MTSGTTADKGTHGDEHADPHAYAYAGTSTDTRTGTRTATHADAGTGTGTGTGTARHGDPVPFAADAGAAGGGAGTAGSAAGGGSAAAESAPAQAAPWGELVTAALLGSGRRTPPGGSVHALLDAAALATVRQRAGLRPGRAAPRPVPAPEDGRPPLPRAAERRLAVLLAGRSEAAGSAGGRRGALPDLAELLPQWLSAAHARGYRPPAAQLPALLDAARARTDLRPAALAFAGPRALWLARLNPEWRFALRDDPRPDGGGLLPPDDAPGGARQGTGEPDGDAADGAPDEAAARRLWDEGLFAERVTLLGALRSRDPATGRALLAGTWSAERAEDRLVFLDTLRQGLSLADEPFLEGALGDRSRLVRARAAALLGSLPGSALAARMAVRARACVRLEHASDGGETHSAEGPGDPGGPGDPEGGPYIAVEPPHTCDAAMQRDGVTAKPPAGRGERSWWLQQVVEAAPLGTWSAHFGGRQPSGVAALPVAGEWRQDLHAAWSRAAVLQRDVAWARALIGPPTLPLAEGAGDPAKLLTVLPEEERAAWAARFVAAHGLSEAFRVLGVCAVPWAEPLGRSVVDALEIARDAGSYPWSFSGVMGLAERCLDPADAARLEPLAAVPDEPEGASPGAGAYWAEAFQRLVATLRLRATMLDELAAGAPEGAAEQGRGAQSGAGTTREASAEPATGRGTGPGPG